MHAEPGRSVDLADAAADFAVGKRDVLREEVDAADVKADRLDRAHRHVAVVRVDDVRDVGRRAARREVRGRAQVHLAPGFRHGIRGELGSRQHRLGLRVDIEARQHFFMADAAPRILVHDLDQLRDRVLAVADHVPGRAARRSDQLAIHDEQPVVVAFEVALDDDGA